MIARVRETAQGFVIVVPQEYAEAWGLREDFPLEVHRVGHTSEEDEPSAIAGQRHQAVKVFERSIHEQDEAYRELAKGPEGVGPHDPPPFDLRKF
jgi:hypothetical protein